MDAETAYRKYREELLRYLYRLTGEPSVAEDLAQEVFARLVASPREKRDVRAWLYTVGRNLVRERARTRANRSEFGRKASLPPTPLPTPDEEYERRRVIERVRRALGTLRPSEEQLLLMRHEGFSRKEIGRALGVSPNSVSTLAARALRKLADAYEELDMERTGNPTDADRGAEGRESG